MEIQQSYLEIFDSDGDLGSKDDDGRDARTDQINYQAFCFNEDFVWSFFHINDKSQIVLSNVANYNQLSLEQLIFIPIWHLVRFDLKDGVKKIWGFTKSQENNKTQGTFPRRH